MISHDDIRCREHTVNLSPDSRMPAFLQYGLQYISLFFIPDNRTLELLFFPIDHLLPFPVTGSSVDCASVPEAVESQSRILCHHQHGQAGDIVAVFERSRHNTVKMFFSPESKKPGNRFHEVVCAAVFLFPGSFRLIPALVGLPGFPFLPAFFLLIRIIVCILIFVCCSALIPVGGILFFPSPEESVGRAFAKQDLHRAPAGTPAKHNRKDYQNQSHNSD